MDDPFFVRGREAAGDLDRIVNRLPHADRAADRHAERRAVEQLGDGVRARLP